MLHKIRHAMQAADNREPLTGFVRFNVGKYGDPYSPFDDRRPKEHPLIVGVSVGSEGAIEQIKLKQLADEHLEPGTKLVNPWGWAAFRKRHIDPSAERIERGRSQPASLFRDNVGRIASWASPVGRFGAPAYSRRGHAIVAFLQSNLMRIFWPIRASFRS